MQVLWREIKECEGVMDVLGILDTKLQRALEDLGSALVYITPFSSDEGRGIAAVSAWMYPVLQGPADPVRTG